MKLIIDIPESIYETIEEDQFISRYQLAVLQSNIRKGVPLPKGHGRLIDVDKIIKKMKEREKHLKDDRSMYETACVETALDMFGDTIIEADKAESEE